jgi:hypothetical protein
VNQLYCDLFLLASLVFRPSRSSPDTRLLMRLVKDPPHQDAWLTLGHADERDIHAVRLSPSEVNFPLPDPRDLDSIPADLARKTAEVQWRLDGGWLLEEIRRVGGDEAANLPIRLNIVTASSSLWAAPWEWLLPGLQERLSGQKITVNRAVPMRYAPAPLQVRESLRLMVLPSSPTDERKMNVSEELQLLHTPDEIQRMDAHVHGSFEAADQIQRFQPNILHYIGHAGTDGADGNLILQDRSQRSEWLSSRGFQKLLHPSIRLIALSTCVTTKNYDIFGFARLALSDSCTKVTPMPSIIYTQFPVSPRGAEVFWQTFYQALLEHQGDLTEAVDTARSAVRDALPDFADWSSFVLVLRDAYAEGAGRPFSINAQHAHTKGFNIDALEKAPPPSLDLTELESFFASQLANGLESLQVDATSAPSEWKQRLQEELDQIKKKIR